MKHDAGWSLPALLPQAVALARAAGEAVMAVYDAAGEMAVAYKGDDSPLTQADLAAHHLIVAGLAQLAPHWPVLSEESAAIPYSQRQVWRRFWLVDPLDGTKEFVKRNGEFTVNIALIENGIPVLGVVHAPVLDVTYSAAQGAGAWRQDHAGKPEKISAQGWRQGETLKVVVSRSHGDERLQGFLAKFARTECVNMGSSLKLCLVAEGKAQVYPRFGPTMEWDTAAAHAIVTEAGAVLWDFAGAALKYNKADLHNPPFVVLGSAANQAFLNFLQGL